MAKLPTPPPKLTSKDIAETAIGLIIVSLFLIGGVAVVAYLFGSAACR